MTKICTYTKLCRVIYKYSWLYMALIATKILAEESDQFPSSDPIPVITWPIYEEELCATSSL